MGIEVSFSFDTTGSMASCIDNVRKNIEKLCSELFKEISGLRIGMIAHGDYCDGDNCVNILPLTNNIEQICKFVRTVPNTGGGDSDECYELALHLARNLGWSPDANKILVMIGDCGPHEINYVMNKDHLDWKEELSALKSSGVKVYPLQCQGNTNPFWSQISKMCDTSLMNLDNFSAASELIKGFVYACAGEEIFSTYEDSLSNTNMPDDVSRNLEILRAEATKF